MIRTERTRLGSELERGAERCTRILGDLAERYPDVERTPFANEVRLAVAAMETAVQQLDAPPPARQSALLITTTLARQAAAAARCHGIDEAVLQIASACDAVAALCESALAAR